MRSNQVWRRRHCLGCDNIFTTIESSDLTTSLLVRRNTGFEPFQRDKLLLSIYECLRHRKDAITAATGLAATIVSKLLPLISEASLTREQIISISTEVLKNFDHAAYIQYQAFHPVKG